MKLVQREIITTAKCNYVIDCRRVANPKSGRCDLHDAIVMAEDAKDLLRKVLDALHSIARKNREDDND